MKEGVKIAVIVMLFCVFAADLGYHAASDFGSAEALSQPPAPQDGSSASRHERNRFGQQERDSTISPIRPASPNLALPTYSRNQWNNVNKNEAMVKREELGISNWAQVGYSAATLLVTVGLFSVGAAQLKTFREQARIIEEQANIADRQLKLMEDLERPLILLRYLGWSVEGWKQQADKRQFPSVTVSLANFGRGTALVYHCRIGFFIGVNPPERQDSRKQKYMSALMRDEGGRRRILPYINYFRGMRALMPQSDPWDIPLHGPGLTPEQIDEIGTGHQTVWIDAVAYYGDIRKNRLETHFRYVYDREADIFIPDETAPEFNRYI